MRTLIFSDIHGNLPAFELMLKQERGIDLYISLGDVVNYGPWSNECVDLLESLQAIRLFGNHEEYFITGIYPGRSELVKLFFQTTLREFSRMKQILDYQPEYLIGNFTCRHTIDDIYIYPDTIINATGNYFIGHSHHQFDRSEKKNHVINVGSVGQNRREINVINYCVFDPESSKVELKSIVYDISALVDKMKELKYPIPCIDYYLQKPLRK